MDPDVLCSPCDGLVSAYTISRSRHFSIKHTDYTLDQLLKDRKLASRYTGGTAWCSVLPCQTITAMLILTTESAHPTAGFPAYSTQ